MLTTETPVISVMTVNPITVGPEISLDKVQELLDLHQVRHILVVNEEKSLIGIVSQTDLTMLGMIKNGPTVTNLESSSLSVSDVMTSELVSLEPDDSISRAADLFLTKEVHALPVLDDGELIGIVTSHDLLRSIFEDVLPLSFTKWAKK